MVTENTMKALNIRAELDLWKGRRIIYGARKKALMSEYVLKKDAVDRMERSILKKFFQFSEKHEDKSAKEKWEADEAKKALEKVEFYIEEGEKRIPELERQMAAEMSFKKMVQTGSDNPQNEAETTEKNLVIWCELVEEAISMADGITSFLKDLLVCMERSNNANARGSEISDIQIAAWEIAEKINSLFKRLKQKYGESEKWNNIKPINARRIVLIDRRNMRGTIQENALLYTIQDDMEDFQKILVETFAAMEADGELLAVRLKRECKETENFVTDEKERIDEKSSVKYIFSNHLENKPEKQEEIFPSYVENKIINHDAVFFQGEDNLEQEREALLNGLRLLKEELKSSRDEMQKGFRRSRSQFFRKYKMDSHDEEQVPVEIKKLEENIEAWLKKLKEFKRKARNFPCVLDEFVSVKNKRLNMLFENEKATFEQGGYLTYVDELERMLKTAEKQLTDFCMDS